MFGAEFKLEFILSQSHSCLPLEFIVNDTKLSLGHGFLGNTQRRCISGPAFDGGEIWYTVLPARFTTAIFRHSFILILIQEIE